VDAAPVLLLERALGKAHFLRIRSNVLRLQQVNDGVWADGDFYPNYWYEGACETCARTVFKEGRYMRRHFFCGRGCDEVYWSRSRRKPKAKKTCEVCDKEFTAKRVDTKTCSPACKQKAYRQRVKGEASE
jgi:hypothetical protein